jgi:predicted RNase H-like HicB family nuclease
MKKYAVVYERSRTGYSAYVPDLPGCIAAAKTFRQTRKLIREAIEFHIEGLREAGERVPKPTTQTETVEVGA